MCVMFGVGAIADVAFGSMVEILGWQTYIVFSAFAFMGALHIQIMLVETKGRKLTEIRKLFKDFECMDGVRR